MKKIIILLIIITAIVALLVYWRYGKKADSGETSQVKGVEKLEDIEQKVLSFTIDGRSSKGAQQWHLEGNSAEIRDENIHLNGLKAVVYGENVTADITSDKGIYNKDEGEVELIGNVKVFFSDGLILTTERARWSQATKEISTDTVVHIKKEGMSAVGKGGMANSDKKKAMLKENVMVIMEPDTKVNCDGPLEVNYNDNVAIFHKNVRVEDKGGKLFADKLTVNFDPETQKLAQVVAEGNVKVKRGKSYTLSEKAIYTDSTQSAKLLGRPRVIIDPAELAELDGFAPEEVAATEEGKIEAKP